MTGNTLLLNTKVTETKVDCYTIKKEDANAPEAEQGKCVLALSLISEADNYDQVCIYLTPKLMRELVFQINDASYKEIGEEKL